MPLLSHRRCASLRAALKPAEVLLAPYPLASSLSPCDGCARRRCSAPQLLRSLTRCAAFSSVRAGETAAMGDVPLPKLPGCNFPDPRVRLLLAPPTRSPAHSPSSALGMRNPGGSRCAHHVSIGKTNGWWDTHAAYVLTGTLPPPASTSHNHARMHRFRKWTAYRNALAPAAGGRKSDEWGCVWPGAASALARTPNRTDRPISKLKDMLPTQHAVCDG
jgi:hypothetical protein